MLALIQTDAELGEIFMRALILRRVELIAAGVGILSLLGQHILPVRLGSKSF
jgi:thioredoxin reductase (NADPH)